jgi:hypothetical protein
MNRKNSSKNTPNSKHPMLPISNFEIFFSGMISHDNKIMKRKERRLLRKLILNYLTSISITDNQPEFKKYRLQDNFKMKPIKIIQSLIKKYSI